MTAMNDTDAARRDRIIAENSQLRQEIAELRLFVREIANLPANSPYVDRAREIISK